MKGFNREGHSGKRREQGDSDPFHIGVVNSWVRGKLAFVPKSAKASSPKAKSEEIPFEEALKRLEAVVDDMEQEELPLETLLTRFEEGTRLAQRCQEKLAEAEVRIRKLEKDAGGEFSLSPVEEDLGDES
jgi:exodeoxyribonuclease VII small subunit